MLRLEETEDLDDHFIWDRIESFYENLNDGEQLKWRTVFFDDGTVRRESYSDGQRSYDLQWDNSEDPSGTGAVPWSSIETIYDDVGRKTNRVIVYDDGATRHEVFSDDTLIYILDTDDPGSSAGTGTRSWTTRESIYDYAGQLTDHVIYYDDGVVRKESFENGFHSYLSLTDGPGDASGVGVKPWTSITFDFDGLGQKTNQSIVYDDGVIRSLIFSDNVRRYDQWYDNPQDTTGSGAKPWSSIATVYDQNGKTLSELRRYDDGASRLAEYEDGVLREVFWEDENSFGPNRPWSTILEKYDDEGRLTSRLTNRDDGVEREELFESGVRVELIEHSILSVPGPPSQCTFLGTCPPQSEPRVWTKRTTTFDQDGNVLQQIVEFSDSDRKALIYVDGSLAERQLYDGGGDETWLVHQTIFSEDGNPLSVTAYNEGDTLPELIVLPDDGVPDDITPPSQDVFG